MARIRVGSRAALPLIALAVAGLAGCTHSDDQARASAGTGGGKPAATGTTPAPDAMSAPPAKTSVDACSLVTKQEAEALAGTPLDDAQPVRDTCTYTGPTSGPTAQVEVFVGDGAKKFLDIDRDALGHQFTTLTGVGDEAYLEDGAVFISRSGTWVSIRLVRLNDPADNRKPLEDLARTVAGRL